MPIIAAVLVGLPVAVLLAGQMNLLSGTRPNDLGVANGRLKAPADSAQNVVSSQAETDAHRIAPLRFTGEPAAAFAKLERIVRGMDGADVVTAEFPYLYAEYRTKMLHFVDDVEFIVDASAGVIHMRSASRVGRRDFGVNRARLEAVRAAFDPA